MSLSMRAVHRAHRLQQRRALLELGRLGVDALEHQARPWRCSCRAGRAARASARRAGGAASPRWRATWFSICCAPSCDDLLEHLAALRQQLRAERRFEHRQAALVQRHRRRRRRAPRAPAAPTAETRAAVGRRACAPSRAAAARSAPRPARSVASGSSSASILFSTTKRVGACAPRWSRQIARSDLVTPVSAPRMKTVACARRQQAQRQLGLGADRVQARRVEHDQALLEQRMRIVDQRVAPGRHLDLAFVVARRVVVGRVVVPEAERARLLLGDPLGARHLAAATGRAGPGRRCRSAKRLPGARLARAARRARGPRAGSRSAAAAARPARRRVQPSSTGHIVVRPGRGRQDAPAGVGEEDGVDQLRLAARELGDEGDARASRCRGARAATAICSPAAPCARSCSARKRASVVDAVRSRAPRQLAEGVETGREGMASSRRRAKGAEHRSPATHGTMRAETLAHDAWRRTFRTLAGSSRRYCRAADSRSAALAAGAEEGRPARPGRCGAPCRPQRTHVSPARP